MVATKHVWLFRFKIKIKNSVPKSQQPAMASSYPTGQCKHFHYCRKLYWMHWTKPKRNCKPRIAPGHMNSLHRKSLNINLLSCPTDGMRYLISGPMNLYWLNLLYYYYYYLAEFILTTPLHFRHMSVLIFWRL